jgi:hypothetical protein
MFMVLFRWFFLVQDLVKTASFAQAIHFTAIFLLGITSMNAFSFDRGLTHSNGILKPKTIGSSLGTNPDTLKLARVWQVQGRTAERQ